MVGQTISHYKILEKLGEGGMGVVYKAQDTKLDRMVALKFLPLQISASSVDKERFVQEAKAASSINHPNICTIHDIQDHDGSMFIVMEFVEGQTLRDKSQSSPPNLKSAIDIGVQIAEGLAAAHEKGIVHRDIKPENIMVRKDGIVQIMDFGLAKLRGVSRLTKEGSTVGTAGYMSPEQVQGQDADHRSDIFSLGALLYEMFAGRLPFKGVHETALMYEIVNVDAVPMSSVKPEIDPELERIVLECLEKDPNERSQSAKQIANDLKRARRESSRQRMSRIIPSPVFNADHVPTAPISETKSSFIWPVISMVLVALVAVALWRPWQKETASTIPVTRFSVKLPADAPLAGGFTSLALSPDGKFLVYSTYSSGFTDLRLRRMDDMTSKPIPGTQGATGIAFSPDGKWIAFDAINGRLKRISLFGGAAEDVWIGNGLRGVHWATDGYIYFGHISKGIHRVPENGGAAEVVSHLDSAAGEISHRTPQFLPEHNTLIYTVKLSNISSFDEALIVAENLGTKERKVIIRGGSHAMFVPPGFLVYARQAGLFAAPFDPSTLETSAPPSKLFEGGWINPYSGDACYSIIANGTIAYVPLASESYEIASLEWMDRSGKLTPLHDKSRSFWGGALSPDGLKVATTMQAANDDIWIFHSARKTLTRLTFGGGNHGEPQWTPDGKYVIYLGERGQSANIFRRSWDGSGKEERLTVSDRQQYPNSISPDGKHLAFAQDGDIWMLPLDGDGKAFPFIQSPADEFLARFSPDGKYLAYNSTESGKLEVYVVPFPRKDGKWQVSAGGGFGPLWSRRGTELYYSAAVDRSKEGAMMAVPVTLGSGFDFGTPRKLCPLPEGVQPPTDISTDDSRFLLVKGRAVVSLTSEIHVVINWVDELKEKFVTRRD